MFEDFGILLGGIFIGAVAAEVIHRKCPGIGKKFCTKICNVTSGAKDAFKAGYENATRLHQAAAESVDVQPA